MPAGLSSMAILLNGNSLSQRALGSEKDKGDSLVERRLQQQLRPLRTLLEVHIHTLGEERGKGTSYQAAEATLPY